jgi:spoIIIJ-associated protein
VRSIVKTAKTADEAIAQALNELGCQMDQVNIEIIKEAKAGFLGIGSQNAVVKVSLKEDPFAEILRPSAEAEAERSQAAEKAEVAEPAAKIAEAEVAETAAETVAAAQPTRAAQPGHGQAEAERNQAAEKAEVAEPAAEAVAAVQPTRAADQTASFEAEEKVAQKGVELESDFQSESEPADDGPADESLADESSANEGLENDFIRQILKGGRDVTPKEDKVQTAEEAGVQEPAQANAQEAVSASAQDAQNAQEVAQDEPADMTREDQVQTHRAGSKGKRARSSDPKVKNFFWKDDMDADRKAQETESWEESWDEGADWEDQEDRDYKVNNQEQALTFVENLLDHILDYMHVDGHPEVSVEGDRIRVEIKDTDDTDTGIIIGRRAETLDALQYLTGIALNRQSRKHYRIFLDAAGYRGRRRASLIKTARSQAAKVQKTHRSVSLEPMNSYERRIVHTALQGMDGIYTESEGKEPHRKVVIRYQK